MGCATQGEKAEVIQELRGQGYQLSYLLKIIGLPRSTFYYEIKQSSQDKDAKIKVEIQKVFDKSKGRYGVRRTHRQLVAMGYSINHKKVQRLMHLMGLKGRSPKEKYHSYKGKVGKVASNIIDRDFHTNECNQKWSTDISQFTLPFGKVYFSPILDMCNNEIVAYNLSQSPNLEQIKDMLDKAFLARTDTEGLIIHSDQGWQYQHQLYTEELKKHGIVQSMSRKGNC